MRSATLSRAARAGLAGGAAAVLAAAILTTSAGAQSVTPGGYVDDMMQLNLTAPTGFSSFPHHAGDNVYTLPVDAEVTSTTANTPISLSVADGLSTNPTKRGHLLSAGGHPLPLPMEVTTAATGNLLSLDQAIAPVVATWGDVVSLSPVSFELSQEIDGTTGVAAGPYGAEVVVTLTSEAP
jgi:hypothetical protein